jgi:hypothetical protein
MTMKAKAGTEQAPGPCPYYDTPAENSDAWQPISSAPRDGTTVLLFAPGWDSSKTGWTFGKANWQDCPFHHGGDPKYEPTHWMPLPSPPSP